MGLRELMYFIEAFIIFQTIISAVMCVYGYKWAKGLIATTSVYIGIYIGIFVAAFLVNSGTDEKTAIIVVPIVAFLFWGFAYIWKPLNHFLAGFLLATKVAFMIIEILMNNEIMDIDFEMLIGIPIVLGIIFGFVACSIFNNWILLLCVTFVGATNLVPHIFTWIDRGSFVITGDISYIMDPQSLILSLFGIEIPSFWEGFFIIAVFLGSFFWQKLLMKNNGINMNKIVDDR